MIAGEKKYDQGFPSYLHMAKQPRNFVSEHQIKTPDSSDIDSLIWIFKCNNFKSSLIQELTRIFIIEKENN